MIIGEVVAQIMIILKRKYFFLGAQIIHSSFDYTS